MRRDWPAGIKRTRQRALVLELLERSPLPLSAQEIAKALERQDTRVCLSTVYRVLDVFTTCGVAVKTDMPENGLTLYERATHQHRHYAVCLACRRMILLENCPLGDWLPELAEQNFRVVGHKLQMYGYCTTCQPQESADFASEKKGY